ncbi:methyltransferase [Brevibacterium yomogidense]
MPTLSARTLEALAAALHTARCTPAGLRGLWGTDADAALDANDPAPARRHCRAVLARDSATRDTGAHDEGNAPVDSDSSRRDRSLAAVALLFLLDAPVDRTHVVEAVGASLVDELTDAGLLAVERPAEDDAPESTASVRSVLSLTPHPLPVGVPRGMAPGDDTLLLFADHGTLTRPDVLDGDYVLGYGGAGRTLLDITPRDRVALAAEIGTGCGIQAALLARHADHVIATDLSQRALDIARLTIGLAGVADRVEFRRGSLYEPLPERVDLLVSNPPFVITPRTEDGKTTAAEAVAGSGAVAYGYRDGGLAGDAIMRTMVAGAPARLRDDGTAVMLGNWEYGTGRTPPTDWVGASAEGTETSAMVIERQRMLPAEYARTWIRDGGVARASARWHADVDRWLSDFADRGVDEVGFGWVLLHRHGASGEATAEGAAQTDTSSASLRDFAAIDSGPGSNPAGLAAFLETRMALLEWLAGATDGELADTAFQLAPDVTEHRHLRPGAEDPTMITIEQGGGLAQTFQADPALAGFLGVCDGTLTLAQIAAALAHLLGVDDTALTAQLADQVRALVPAAVIVPAAD